MHSAVAIKELLRRVEWRPVQFLGAFDQVKAITELIVKRFGIVSQDIESTAPGGTFRAKSAHNHMIAAPYGGDHVLRIGDSLFPLGQKVKYRAVMPKIVEVPSVSGSLQTPFREYREP